MGKKKTFSKVSQVKKLSRVAIGPVPPPKIVPHKNKETGRAAKYPKQTLDRENVEE
jgi:hypothetical protein